MANVSITNIQSGMTVGTTFVAYGQFDTGATFMSAAAAAPAPMVTVTMKIRAGIHTPSSYQQTVAGQHGYWQAGFSGLPTGTHCVLKAVLNVSPAPPPAEATELTVSNGVVSAGATGDPPAPQSEARSADQDNRQGDKPGHKVKRQFTIGGTYTPGPQDIVIVGVRKNGTQRGQSVCHGLNLCTKTWEDTVNANAGEIGKDYAIIVELQHCAKRIATCALLGVEIEM